MKLEKQRDEMLLSCAKGDITVWHYFKWLLDNEIIRYTGTRTQKELCFGGYHNSRAGQINRTKSNMDYHELKKYEVPVKGVDYTEEYICDGYVSYVYSADGDFYDPLDYGDIPYSPKQYNLDEYCHYGYIQDEVIKKCKELGMETRKLK